MTSEDLSYESDHIFLEILLFIQFGSKTKKDKHSAELYRTDPGTNDTMKISTGRIIPHNGQNGFKIFPLFEFQQLFLSLIKRV